VSPSISNPTDRSQSYRSPNPPNPYEIVLLADYPEALSVITAGYEAEWEFWYGSGGKGNAKSDLLERSQRRALPLSLVAKRGGCFVGAIAIAANAISLRPELTPCVIGLWVAPAHRECGIGTALLNAAIVKAAELGFGIVYSATTTEQSLFMRAGWKKIDKKMLRGEAFSIFAAECGQAGLKADREQA